MMKYFKALGILMLGVVCLPKISNSQNLQIEFIPNGALSTTVTANHCKLNQYDLKFQMDWDQWAEANLINNNTTTEKIQKVVVTFQFRDFDDPIDAFYYIVPLQISRNNNAFNNINDPYYASEEVPSAYDLYDYLEMGHYQASVSVTVDRTISGTYDTWSETIYSNQVTINDGGIDEKGSYYANKVGNRLVSGDFDNDGFEDDMVAMYHDGGTSTKIHLFKFNTSSDEFDSSQPWMSSSFDGAKVKGFVSGDFDNDGYKDDLVALYDYGNNYFRAHVFKGNASGLVYAGWWYQSGIGAYGYDLNKVNKRVVCGDFDHDGYEDDLALMYDYGSSSMRIHTLKSNGSSFQSGGSWYYAAPGLFDANKVTGRMVCGDFDHDGFKDDISCFYHYSGSTSKAFIFKSNGSNAFYANTAFSSTTFDARAITDRIVVTDYDNDGKEDDLVAFYYYGGSYTKAFLFKGNGYGFNSPYWIYNSGVGNFTATQCTGICAIDESNNGRVNAPTMIYDLSDFVDVSARNYVFQKSVESSATSLISPSVRWSACNTGIYNYYKVQENNSNGNPIGQNDHFESVSGVHTDLDFVLYPNPTNAEATILINDFNPAEVYEIQLIAITGRILLSKQLVN